MNTNDKIFHITNIIIYSGYLILYEIICINGL
nr:MAG TPA: hypothetical protein [Crassvirales sp.]